MKLKFRSHIFSFSFYHMRYRMAVGVTSKVLDSPESHHLLFDLDGYSISQVYETFKFDYPRTTIIAYDTPHGCHVIVDKHLSFKTMLLELVLSQFVDLSYIRNVMRRGYAFLETRSAQSFPDDFSYMAIERRL